MIRAILFDCFGVLYRDNISMLYDAVPEESHTAVKDLIHATDYGMLTREEYYQGIAELAGKTSEEIREIESRQHARDEVMVAFSQQFRPQYKVGLLSNIDGDTIRRLFPDRAQLFDEFIISGDIMVAKPSVEIFEYAAQKLDLPPEECLMIDDMVNNVEGASRAGMQSLLFTTRRQLEADLARLLKVQDA